MGHENIVDVSRVIKGMILHGESLCYAFAIQVAGQISATMHPFPSKPRSTLEWVFVLPEGSAGSVNAAQGEFAVHRGGHAHMSDKGPT